jgi:stearoyl-CoA 9-desaturase NADPH oxidoreductase
MPVPAPLHHVARVLSWPAPPEAYLRLVRPLAPSSNGSYPAHVVAIAPEGPRAVTLVLAPGTGFPDHLPGQWVGIGVDIDGVRHQRCYSLTSVPGEPLTVTVQRVRGGLVSNHLADRLRCGDVVHLTAPAGDFVLGSGPSRPALFITGGSGITPVVAMLRWLDRRGAVTDAVLLHHAVDRAGALHADELDALASRHPGLRVVLTLTGAGPPPPELALDADRLGRLCPDWRTRDAWACGPPPLLDAAITTWEDETRAGPLHVEGFVTRTAPTPATDSPVGSARFLTSTGTVEAVAPDDRPLLAVAEDAGLLPRHGCRAGVCGSCSSSLAAGTVRDLRDGRLTSGAGATVRICVHAAHGDVDIELRGDHR